MGSPDRFDIVEVGAGRGWLTRGVLETARERYPEFFAALRATAVEKNVALLGGSFEGDVTFHSTLAEVKGPVKGCIFSNELLDAIPFHRVVMREGLKEVYVGLEDGRLVDVEGALSTPDLARYFDRLGVTLSPGRHAEVSLGALQWIKEAGALLEEGYVLSIDYGMEATRLYSPERLPTLMCHRRHTTNDDPYRDVGAQDITAHVDFSSVHRAGEEEGLATVGYTTQTYFMMGLGLDEELMVLGEDPDADDVVKIRHNQGIKELIMPGGMGETFKVLLQSKGRQCKDGRLKDGTAAESGEKFDAFSFKNMKRLL